MVKFSLFGYELRKKNVQFQDTDRTVAASSVGPFWNSAQTAVTVDTAKSISTFYTCVRSIAEDIAKQQCKILQVDSTGNKTLANGHQVYKLLNLNPNGFCNPITFRETIISQAIERGNGYAFIERDTNGYPIALYNLDPDFVVPKLVNRKLFYIINDPWLGIDGTFTAMDVFHLRGMGNGMIGISVLKWAAESVGKAIATQQFASETFVGGALTGLLELTGVSDETKILKIKQAFLESFKRDKLGVIGGASKYTRIDSSAEQNQMIEALDASVNDICRWFRMPLSKVQKSEKTENIEALNIEYVNDCLSGWQVRFEQEVEAKLFDAREKQLFDVKFDNTDLLRGDAAAQERRVKTLYYTGSINPDEIRSYFEMNKIGGEQGRRYFNPVNMVPWDKTDEFWDSKDNKNPTGSADASGSGATNNNINQNGKQD